MSPEAAKYLWDALHAVERVQRFSTNKSFDDYLRDELLRSAIERQFEIVGEALNQLRRVDAETASSIADLPRAVALRNILIHAYAVVDPGIVWGVVETHVSLLQQQLKSALPGASG